MTKVVCSVTVALAITGALGVLHASGPIAVFALVDSVSFEPNAEKPDRVRISGVFLTAESRSDVYTGPSRGYVYFTLPKGNEELAQREWADLKSVAGKRQVVGFGSSWYGTARVRKADEEAKSPDSYVLGNGLSKVNADHPRAKALLDYQGR